MTQTGVSSLIGTDGGGMGIGCTSNHSSSTRSNQPRKRVKRCCRNFVTFMCTQVGVGALIVIYAICGAFSFMHIEREYEDCTTAMVLALRHNCSQDLWSITEELNTFNKTEWINQTDAVLQVYQSRIAALIKSGYEMRTPAQIWSFPAALMFCLSVITMIGYGNMVPRTPWGKGFTVIYATFGIPLYILYFLNMGKILARSFKFLYRSIHECTEENALEKRLDSLETGSCGTLQRKKIIVPSTACLWVIIFYILTGTIMFANWEKWSFLNSFYFCMTSLCKIGFGDFVPGASLITTADINAASHKLKIDYTADPDEVSELQLITDQHSKLAINFMYMLVGMGLVAMCYNLMREEVRVKLKEMREDTKLCLEDTRSRFVTIDHFLQLQEQIKKFSGMLGGGAERLCTPSTSAGPFRIFSVAGYQNRANDIVYCPPIIRQQNQNVEDSTAIVYFGGDVQDFPESMETNRDSRGYMKYNLENSAILLREAFPRSHIIVIRPVRMEFKTFSCFDNFVRGNNAGVPDHTPMNYALQHLEKLLQNLSQRLISIPENEILDQAAQAAAAAAAVAAAAAAAALTLSNASGVSSESSSSSSSSNASDSSQEMDIDILQVQENVTVDADGAVIFPNVVTAAAVAAAAAVAVNNEDGNTGADVDTTAENSTDNATDDMDVAVEMPNQQQTQREQEQQTQPAPTNNGQHYNNVNNSNDCAAMQQQQQQQQQRQLDNNPLWWRENLNLDKSKLILIGFSKGCVVLNQFIYEFHYLKTLTPDDSTMGRLLSRIKDMYWLDGGHGGQKNTWITSRSLLETLTRMGMNIHVHLTPYQVQDDRRPWIRKEEKIFTDMLRRLGAAITRHLHYDNQSANLMTHFEVLQAFCQHVHALNQHQSNSATSVEQQQQQLQQQQPQLPNDTQQQQHQQQQQQSTSTVAAATTQTIVNNINKSNEIINKTNNLDGNEEK